jgi:transposase-like protein
MRSDESFEPLPRLPPLAAAPAASLTALRPPDPALLGPLAPGSITLIRGARGGGKSWLALGMAHAIAGDSSMLGWRARPAPVLYVEAAMSGTLLGARLRAMGPAPRLQVMVDVRLDLTGTDDQARLVDLLPEGGVLVLDGLSLLTRSGREAWADFAGWLRRMRRAGHAVVLVDPVARPVLSALADTLITVKRGEGEGQLSCSVEITSRLKLAAADRAFVVALDTAEGRVRWRRAALVPPELKAVIDAAAGGGTVRDIAARAGLATATAWRRLARAKALGLIGEADETSGTAPAAAPPESPAARSLAGAAAAQSGQQPPETGGTDLAQVSTAVLKRTLARRKEEHGKVGQRPGPAILAGFDNAALAAECARRLKPTQAERLLQQYAPMAAE